MMTERQAYALAHPVSDVRGVPDRGLWRQRRDRRTGLLLDSILAVDR